jgi:hypothetical protein
MSRSTGRLRKLAHRRNSADGLHVETDAPRASECQGRSPHYRLAQHLKLLNHIGKDSLTENAGQFVTACSRKSGKLDVSAIFVAKQETKTSRFVRRQQI